MSNATLVCDIGNVLVTRNPQQSEQWLDDPTHYLETAYVPGVAEVLRTLTKVVGPERAWLLSKCSPETERRTREFLEQRFYAETGMRLDRVRFCRDRTGPAGKAPIILDQLWDRNGPLLVIDDRAQILVDVQTVALKRGLDVAEIHLFAFRPNANELDCYASGRAGLHVVNTAHQLLAEALAVLPAEALAVLKRHP